VIGDPNARKIVRLGPDGKLAATWGSPGTGQGQFNGKYSPGIGGIAYAQNGDIYATDTWNGRVEEFTPGGKFVRAWGVFSMDPNDTAPGHFYGPRGIAVAPNGDVYVADTGHKRIQVFSPTGTYLFAFGGEGLTPGKFNEPSSIAIDQKGNVYVADYWNQRIQVLTLQGQFERQIAIPTWQPLSYDEPQIAVDAAGRLYAPDPAKSRVLVFSPTGQPLLTFGTVGTGLGQLNQPLGVVVGPNNTILVSDAGNTRVLRFTAP
jgi:DNA-binding beta-propeller fold protein YncE